MADPLRPPALTSVLLGASLLLGACAPGEPEAASDAPDSGAATAEAPASELGPADGHDLPPVDTGRVAVGDVAPDFTLASFRDGPVTLSDFRGAREVVLVFYRGHW